MQLGEIAGHILWADVGKRTCVHVGEALQIPVIAFERVRGVLLGGQLIEIARYQRGLSHVLYLMRLMILLNTSAI